MYQNKKTNSINLPTHTHKRVNEECIHQKMRPSYCLQFCFQVITISLSTCVNSCLAPSNFQLISTSLTKCDFAPQSSSLYEPSNEFRSGNNIDSHSLSSWDTGKYFLCISPQAVTSWQWGSRKQ